LIGFKFFIRDYMKMCHFDFGVLMVIKSLIEKEEEFNGLELANFIH